MILTPPSQYGKIPLSLNVRPPKRASTLLVADVLTSGAA
ncbi:MAG: hypothetical protein BSOLF_1593 [Candidatus Carbobacillus altaicus]|uniref:Uncharacterized protein n=1 Tax=Candidatus Carbonibacillus altaicus TaxID=2163959 RepID=A0A2R6Y448_9BACL|nr:MAG: hypothetical protein BSOLF_1593 [Candidatus Carbobacillus altaicus]